MGLSYYYTFSAPKSVSAAKLESFLRTVEKMAQKLGFDPTFVLNGPFATDEQKQFIRRITHGLLLEDERLKGVTLLDENGIWNHDPERGECRLIPEKGILLVVTDERKAETVFGFLWYPDTVRDLNGKVVASSPHEGKWYYHDFVDNPDKRYRTIVQEFERAGYLESETDEYFPK